MQKCPIAFYAKKKSCKYHREICRIERLTLRRARLKFDTEIESLAGTRRAPAAGFAPGW